MGRHSSPDSSPLRDYRHKHKSKHKETRSRIKDDMSKDRHDKRHSRDNDDVERRQSQKNGRTRKQEPEEDVKFKRPKIQREWDVGKLKSEPFGGNIERPDFAPSGRLAGSSKSRGDDEKEREKPCFEPSGKLAKDTNMYKGVLIKYNEPPEAKLPRLRWRMYPFKGEESLPVIYIHRQSAYLIGKDRKIADFPVDHPSCSRQHAVIQYRSLAYERSDGSRGRRTRPYIIDLGSANGTWLNNQRIEPQRYYELKEEDILRFGFSSREFVMLNENSVENRNENDESDEETGGVEIDEEAEKRYLADDDLLN